MYQKYKNSRCQNYFDDFFGFTCVCLLENQIHTMESHIFKIKKDLSKYSVFLKQQAQEIDVNGTKVYINGNIKISEHGKRVANCEDFNNSLFYSNDTVRAIRVTNGGETYKWDDVIHMNREHAYLEYQIPAQGTQNPILKAKWLLQKNMDKKLLCIFNKWGNKTSLSQDYVATGKVIKVCGNKCTIRFTKTNNALSRLFGDTKKRVRDVQEDEGGLAKRSKL